jgi:polysaccharide pyruvyl transferase WcaK-like protein
MVMQILHIASFTGNIGDNASHIGLENILGKVLKKSFKITRHEVRRYYKNIDPQLRKNFDNSFVSYANEFDFIIIGGGGFLDYFVKNSSTGTTIDINIDLLEQINTPILFSSIGCVPNNSIPKGNKKKFQHFLDYILSSKKIDLLVRNDGSKDNLNTNFNLKPKYIKSIIDNGFHFSTNFDKFIKLKKNYVAMSISSDQIKMTGPGSIKINEDTFYEEYRKTIIYIIRNLDLDVCLIPHIYTDLVSISRVISKLDDQIVRKNITIAPCIQGDYGAHYNFSVYKNSELIVGTRFHTNVCGVAMNINTIGITTLKRVEYMYDSIGMQSSYLRGCGLYSDNLCKKITESLIKKRTKENRNTTKIQNLKNESVLQHKNSIKKLLS